MEILIILVFMGIGSIVFVAGALKILSKVRKNFEAIGGLEGLNAARLRMIEEHPARIFPIVIPMGKVKTARLVWSIMVFSVLVSFGVGGFFQFRVSRAARLLEGEGVVVAATVAARSISENDDGDETYYVTYTFNAQAANGESLPVKRKESVPYALFARVEDGGRIEVIYARSDPTVARMMANYTPGKVSYLPIFVGGIMGLVGLLLATGFYRYYQNAARLDAEGFPISVTILDLFETWDSDSTTYYIAYILPDGQKIRHTVRSAVYQRLHVGDSIRIVYLPDNPKIFRPEWE